LKRLLLLGGGHSHVEVLRQFGVRPIAGVDITLVSPVRFAPYSGMLPGLIAGHYKHHECHINIERLARFAGARFLRTHSRDVEPARQEVVLAEGSTIQYDILSIDVGSTSAMAGVPGAAENAIATRPVEALLQAWNDLTERAAAGANGLGVLAVVGGGAAGVELLLAMQYRLAQLFERSTVRFVLVTDTDRLLTGHDPKVHSAFRRILSERQIDIHFASRIARVEPNVLVTANGHCIAADAIVWATGAGGPPRLSVTGLALDTAGFIAVNEHLQSISSPAVFAAGDCATIGGYAYPKSGVYAVRQGPPLAANLRRSLAGAPLVAYRPQRRALALISTGDKYAVASYGPLTFESAWVWRWKDYIDRRFMAKYNVPA
jgi:selenide, water dikinase